MNRDRFWSVAAWALLGAVATTAVLAPAPFLTLAPGPVFDILGETDGQPTLKIEDSRSYPTTGQLDMTTVSEFGGPGGSLTAAGAIWGLLTPGVSVVPLKARYPNGTPGPEEQAYEQHVFDESQSDALAAAARYLHRPLTSAVVVSVTSGSPADGQLQPGDVILTVDGTRVSRALQVGTVIRSEPPGAEVTMRIDRGGKPKTVSIQTVPSPDNPDRAMIGISLGGLYASDFKPVLSLPEIGGPSAGLMLSIAMVDKLTPGDMVAGRRIAGTGTIDAHGKVGAIGGIDKKMAAAAHAGAQLFIAPASNCEDLVGAEPSGLPVVPVSTLADAVDAIGRWQAGEALPVCPGYGG